MAGFLDAVARLQAIAQAISGVGTAITNAAQLAPAYSVAPVAITVGGSPFAYQNAGKSNASVLVSGGTVSAIAFSRDGSTYYTVGTTAGMFQLSPGDYLKVTYSGAPTMTLVPR